MTNDTSGDGRTGLAALSERDRTEIVRAVQFETEPARDAIHRLRRVRSCDRDARAGAGDGPTGECLCRDLLVDMLVEADLFLRDQPPRRLRNPPGAVRIHIRKRVVDWTRRRRVTTGALARPERLRTSCLAAGLPDDYHRALLVHLATEAGSLAPLQDDASLLRRLADLLAAEFGGPPADHLPRVPVAVAVVEAACRRRPVPAFDGAPLQTTWWERYIEEPLGRRTRNDDVLLDTAEGGAAEPWRAIEAERAGAAVATVLRVVSAAPDVDAVALKWAADELVRTSQLSAAAAEEFAADPGRLRIAAEQVRVLLAA